MTQVEVKTEQTPSKVPLATLEKGDWFIASDDQIGFIINHSHSMGVTNCVYVKGSNLYPHHYDYRVTPVKKVTINVEQ